MELFGIAFQQRKGLLFPCLLGIIFGVIVLIAGLKIRRQTRGWGIFLSILGSGIILAMLVLMLMIFFVGMNW